MNPLVKEVASLEITDELIAMNKRFQKLNELEEKLEEAEKLAESIYGYGSKEMKAIEKMKDKVFDEAVVLARQAREHAYLCRMFKGAMMLKALKQVEKEAA